MKDRMFILKFFVIVLVIIGSASIYLSYKSYSNKNQYIKKESPKNETNNATFAIMLEQEDGTYEESQDVFWPSSSYKFDIENSKCIDLNGNELYGVLSYDNVNKQALITTKTATFCYLYFNIRNDFTVNASTDGKTGSLPTTNGYKSTLTCNDSTYYWNNKYQRIEFSTVTSDEVKCNLDYTKTTITNPTLLETIEENATEIEKDIIIAKTDANFKILDYSEYSNIINDDDYPFNFANGKWTATMNKKTQSATFKFSPSEDGYYKVDYEVLAEGTGDTGTGNWLYIYLNGKKIKTVYSNRGTVDKSGAVDVGYLTSDDEIKIEVIYFNKNNSFFIEKTNDIVNIESGYRYIGKEPNNYIWFNNELWRIIGSQSVKTSENTIELLPKIIREESFGGISTSRIIEHIADVSWKESDYYDMLNNYYYGAKNGKNTSDDEHYCYMLEQCDFTSTGIKLDSYYKNMLKKVYWSDIGDVSWKIFDHFEYEFIDSKTLGYVGLMYDTDYYVASGVNIYTENSIDENYINNNWLYSQGYEQIMNSVITSLGLFAPNLRSEISMRDDSNFFGNLNFRPVIYLKGDVYLTSGSGTINNPYVLGW